MEIKFRWSEKSIDFFKINSTIDVLEGTARSSKTTSGIFKFGLRVNSSNHNQHMIAAKDAVVARRNIIDCKNGLKDLFGSYVRDGTDPKKGNYLIFTDAKGNDKIIYIVGFKDKARWQAVLGSTVGSVLIDEINTADTDFLAQIYRSGASIENWYMVCTLNPANPDLDIYSMLINQARPIKKYVKDIPVEILRELKREKPRKGTYYWHFNFKDNPAMTDELIERFKEMYPPESFYYGSLINGIRGVTEGVVFGKYLTDALDVELKDVPKESYYWQSEYIKFTIGIDLGNNEIKRGTVLTFYGIGRGFLKGAVIDSYNCSSTEANDLVAEIANKCMEWYSSIISLNKFDGIYIDGYGAIQILIPTIRKKLFALGMSELVHIDLAIKFGDDGGIIARMLLVLLMINQKRLLFNSLKKGALETKRNLKKIVYDEDKGIPLDENKLENDYYDSMCYAITPFLKRYNEVLTPEELNKGGKYGVLQKKK